MNPETGHDILTRPLVLAFRDSHPAATSWTSCLFHPIGAPKKIRQRVGSLGGIRGNIGLIFVAVPCTQI